MSEAFAHLTPVPPSGPGPAGPPEPPSPAAEVEPALDANVAGPPGLTPPSGRFEPTTFLSEVVLELGLADRERVEAAVEAARNPGHTLEDVLLESTTLNDDDLARALAERHRIHHLDLAAFPVDPLAEEMVDPDVSRRHDALPVSRLDECTLLLAMADPADWLAADEIAQLTGFEVRPAAAARSALRVAIDDAAQRWREASRPSRPPRKAQLPDSGPVSPATPAARAGTSALRSNDASVPACAPVAQADRGDLERRLLERSFAERAARLEHERAELERERAELLAPAAGLS